MQSDTSCGFHKLAVASSSRRPIVAAVLALVFVGTGCKSKPDPSTAAEPVASEKAATPPPSVESAKPTPEQCDEVADKLMQLARMQAMDSDPSEQPQFLDAVPHIGEVFKKQCMTDSWSPEAIACILAATTVAAGEKCAALVPASEGDVEINLGGVADPAEAPETPATK